MHMGTVADLLSGLFGLHGYTVSPEAALEGRSGAVYTVPILAESESGTIVVSGHLDGSPLERDAIDEFARCVADVGADRGVLLHLGEEAAEPAGHVVLWDRATLVRLLGETRLAEALGDPLPEMPLEQPHRVAETFEELLPEAFRAAAPDPEPAYAMEAILEVAEPTAASPRLDLDIPELPPMPEPDPIAPFPHLATPPVAMAAPVAAPAPVIAMPMPAPMAPPMAPAPAAAPATPFAAPWSPPTVAAAPAKPARKAPTRPVLPARVTLEDAKRKVKDRLFSVRMTEVLLHPVHLFDYEVDVLQEGKISCDTRDGRVQVHGSDKSALEVDPDQCNPDGPSLLAPDHPYQSTERVLRIQEERANPAALAHVVARHTRTVEVRVPDANNSLFYTERRKVEPKPEQVRLRHLGVFFRPAWRLHGDNGYVDVDAVDGRELDSQLRGSRTDAVLLD
ncbi:MAG: hypothetical protein QOD77_1306 [Thermoplasmata archaeon]|nr:hypothetical protein [Thermoplasmata archaeon]